MVHYSGTAAAVHNTYSLQWAKLLYERYRQHFPEQRLFNLIRSGYSGMQRYGTHPWSGTFRDPFRTVGPIADNAKYEFVRCHLYRF